MRSEIVLLIAAYDKIEKHVYPDNKEKLEHLCGCILAILEDVSAAEQYSTLTRKIMEYIHSDPIQKITLDDIGRFTFFSPIYCDTVFKRETGKSIIDYVIDRRIDEAKRLLLEGTVSLGDIAEAVGFNDYNYFSRVFKTRSGISPSKYRNMALNRFESK
jgi:YesN/AraC family two-component response regulator